MGTLVRSGLQTLPYLVVFDETKEAGELLALCDGIYTLRTENYAGHRKDEVKLFQTLLNLMRSPESLLRITGLRLARDLED